MKYSKEFEDAVNFAKDQNLFLGYGNPNGKILMIGKEHYFNHNHKQDTKEFYQEIINSRNEDNRKNIHSWETNIKENYEFNWNIKIESYLDNSNALTAWWNQKNKQDKNGNGGTSNTYLHYQKIYQNVFLNSNTQSNINFQREIFTTELNDVPSGRSYNLLELKKMRTESIEKRKDLFRKHFFRTFPVVIIASGHYPRDYNFDIEDIFKVKFFEETKIVGKSWYNLHYSSDGKRMLIHTRQLSTSVSNELITSLSNEIKEFLNRLSKTENQ